MRLYKVVNVEEDWDYSDDDDDNDSGDGDDDAKDAPPAKDKVVIDFEILLETTLNELASAGWQIESVTVTVARVLLEEEEYQHIHLREAVIVASKEVADLPEDHEHAPTIVVPAPPG